MPREAQPNLVDNRHCTMNHDAKLNETPALVNRDDRGVLAAIEFTSVPFSVKRIFWITDVTPGSSRAGHAHRTCEQFLFCVNGSITATVTDRHGDTYSRTLTIGDTLHLPPFHWLELSHFSEGSVLGVLASQHYDRSEYIEDLSQL